MKKLDEEIIRTLRYLKEQKEKAAEKSQRSWPQELTNIEAKIEGYRMGLQTCLKPELVDALFAREGFETKGGPKPWQS